MPHRLDPLLRPESIAVVGATQRAGAVGNTVVKNLLAGGFDGRLHCVNPNYSDVEGVDCVPSLADLPEAPGQVIFTVGDARIEAALDDAVAAGVKTAVIYSSLVLAGDREPPLRERIRARIENSGMTVCGANGMGYYNFRDGIWACGFETRRHARGGNVAFISQSGSGMSGIIDCEARIDFNLAVSTGQELSVSLEDYLDYALEQPETRAIGLFMETSRGPRRFMEALEKAHQRRIPVVILKVGRTELSARLAVSHSGALAGSDAVFDAVFDRYGVQRVEDMDALATTLIMFAQPHDTGSGGLATIHDSGGERQLLIDLAERHRVPLAELSETTTAKLASILDPGLPAVNPLDAWSVGGADYHQTMTACFTTLMEDENAALGAVVHDRGPDGAIFPEYGDYLRKANAKTGKPAFLVAARQGTGADTRVQSLTHEGFPVLDGVPAFLDGARSMLAWRDFLQRPPVTPPSIDPALVERWRARFAGTPRPDEAESARWLSECGIPMVALHAAGDERTLLAAASAMSYPVALKTANRDVVHKTDAGGVILDIADEPALCHAYRELSGRLGAKVVLSPMIDGYGVEMILGVNRDPQFGPVVVLGLGGIHAEIMKDVALLLAPFDAATARRSLDGLGVRALLDGARGRPAVDIDAYCQAAARLSAAATAFSDVVREVDINPVRVMERGCLGLDALLVTAGETATAQRKAG